MTSEKINEFTEKYGKAVSKKQLSDLENKLENAREDTLEKAGQAKLKSTFLTVMLSAFLGLFGAGSFYLGRIKAGILKVVFNVVVPLTMLIIFLVWLAPANKTYCDQSFGVAKDIYGIIADTEEEYEGYTNHILVVSPWSIDRADNFKSALDKDGGKIIQACSTVNSAKAIQITGLNDATAVKTVLDGMNFEEVVVENENKTVSVKIDLGDLPELKVSEMDGFKTKFTTINENAAALIEKVTQAIPAGEENSLTDEQKELKDSLDKINLPLKNVQSTLNSFLNDKSSGSLAKCIEGIRADISYYGNDLNADLQNYYSKNKVKTAVEGKLNYKKTFTEVFGHLDAVTEKDDLNDIATEINSAKTKINALSANAIAAAKTYYLNGEYATWLPGVFLMIDGIVILCWWIGEVFADKEKCQKYNYEKLNEAIN